MSDDDTLDDEHEDENRNIRNLREQAKQAKQSAQEAADAKAELDAVRRESAFLKAKIDTDDPHMKYFVDAYKGDLTPEAIRAEAETAGFLKAAEQTPAEEQQAWSRTAHAPTGADPTPPSPDIITEIRNAKSAEEVTAIMERAGQWVEYGDDAAPPEFLNVIPRR